MQWFAVIIGNDSDLSALSKQLTGSTAQISGEDSNFLLRSDRFATLTEPETVRNAAIKIVAELNGVLRLFNPTYLPLQVGAVGQLTPEGVRHYAAIFVEEVLFNDNAQIIGATHADGTPIDIPNHVQNILNISSADPSVAEAMRYISIIPSGNEETDWVNLYKVYDVIQRDQTITTIQRDLCWADRAEDAAINIRTRDRFKASPHPYRHGSWRPSSNEPPHMTISEAAAYINYVLHRWLKIKQGSSPD